MWFAILDGKSVGERSKKYDCTSIITNAVLMTLIITEVINPLSGFYL